MTDLRELQAVLAWYAVPQIGERTLIALMNHAREARLSLAGLWDTPVDDVSQIVPLHPLALAALRADREAIWAQAGADLTEASARGAELLAAGEPDFPPELWQTPGKESRRWPFLFAFGAVGLLDEPRVALVSSRAVSTQALAVTDALADALARRDVPLITSINREAYQASATAAKRHAGPAAMVLDRGFAAAFPSGLEREPVAPARIWDEALDPDLQLLLSPFGWRDHWTARNGKRRDSLIFDLATVIVAVEVREGGHMELECRRAVRRGIPVLALDLGERSGEPGWRLWEESSPATRLPWQGGEAAAHEIHRHLPGLYLEEGLDRVHQGWLRDVALFLCRLIIPREGPSPAIGTSPERGVIAAAVRAWSRGNRPGSSAAKSFLADLWSPGNAVPSRLEALLQRVATGGKLAAIIPSEWLTEERFAGSRSRWLQEARLLLTVGLPAPSGCKGRMAGAAVVVLQRGSGCSHPPHSFAPDRPEMGRFHLRRYLREVTETEAAGTEAAGSAARV